MRELGIDLADRAAAALLTAELAEQADVVVTMGCGDACPYIPGKRYIDWELPDPKGRPLDEVRATRDDIARRVARARRASSTLLRRARPRTTSPRRARRRVSRASTHLSPKPAHHARGPALNRRSPQAPQARPEPRVPCRSQGDGPT